VSPRLARQVGTIVQQTPFSRETILRPRLLQVDEPPLPWSERHMLQCADGQSRARLSEACSCVTIWSSTQAGGALLPAREIGFFGCAVAGVTL
jgi:hypothetical protein